VVLIESSIKDVDPRFALSNYDTKISRLVAPGLTTVDQDDLEPALALAESIEPISELVWEARLRPGLRFSSGEPVTADDVVFTYESTLDPTLGSVHQQGFAERFKKFERVDERTVRIYLQKPLATLLTDLDFGILSAAAADDRRRYREGLVVGAGPYRLLGVNDGNEEVLMERNQHYWGAAPKVEKLLIRTVRDGNARTLMLVGGSADLVQNSIRVDLVDMVAKNERVKVMSGPGAILTYFMMHNERAPLSDVRVRRAIAHAIDRQRVVAAKLNDRAKLATGLLPDSHWAYNGAVPRYEFNRQKAMELLDEAGFPDPDGPGGEPRMRLTYKTSSNQFRLALARIIAAQLGEVGIEVEVRAFEFHTVFKDIKEGNYELASMQTAAITEPDYLYTYFHSERIPTAEKRNLHNRWRFRNQEFDSLTESGRLEMDRDKRVKAYARAQEILAQELPVIPLWHEDVIAVMNVDVNSYRILPSARFAGLAEATK
jgi:peptide/nickel transport system substrate-binding protein